MKLELAFWFALLAGPWLAKLPEGSNPFTEPVLFGRYSALFVLGYLLHATLIVPVLAERLSMQSALRSVAVRVRRISLYLWVSLIVALVGVEVLFRAAPRTIPEGVINALPGQGLFLFPQGSPWRLPDAEIGYRVPPSLTFEESSGAAGGDIVQHRVAQPTAEDMAGLDRMPAAPGKLDERGYRGRSGEGKRTILFLGDSFVHSGRFATEDIWCARAARQVGASCVNLGLFGYGVPQEARVLEREIDHYRPDLVVLAVFEGNDLKDAAEWSAWRQSGMSWFEFQAVDAEWWERSPALCGLELAWLKLAAAAPEAREPRPLPLQPYRGSICGREVVMAFMPPYLDMLAASPGAVQAHPGWPATREGVERCMRLCEARGASFVVALLPSKPSVYAWHVLPEVSPEDAMRATLREPDLAAGAGWLADARRWRNAFMDVLRETCEEEGIPCLDLRPPFFEAAERGLPPTYFSFDSHWNVAGHALAASATANFLAARPELLDSTPARP